VEIIVGREVFQLFPLRLAAGKRFGERRIIPMGLELGAERANRPQLAGIGTLRDHYARGDAELFSGIGDRGAVITGRGRDDAAAANRRIQGEELAEGATRLEGAGVLQVLELQVRAQRRRLQRSFDDPGPDPRLGEVDWSAEV